ncbi:hypothetical protein DIS24_g7431 [Lasiodiplodia hormozganensis]|uniref:Uncharacterized protein n=1 Tax=Lasiodiplodia hormozganensis TaxID=869390 RepID=A0AA40CSG6_9PEZI|nr:hypothetical protein DIS24_g7431 [Lasiodiplodia hormozganensis]
MLCYRLEVQPCLDWLYYSTNRVMDDITDSDENQLQGMPSPVMLFRLTQDIVGLCDFVLIPTMMPDVPQDCEPDVAARRHVERTLASNIEHLALCANSETLHALNFLWDNWTACLRNGQGEKREDIQNERTHRLVINNELPSDIRNEWANRIKNGVAYISHIQNKLDDIVNVKTERAEGINIKTEDGDTLDNKTYSNNNITIGRDAMRHESVHESVHESAHSKTRNVKFWTRQELKYIEKIYHEHGGISPGDAAKMFNDHFRGKTIDGVKAKKRTMHAISHKLKDLKAKQTAEYVKQEKCEESE